MVWYGWKMLQVFVIFNIFEIRVTVYCACVVVQGFLLDMFQIFSMFHIFPFRLPSEWPKHFFLAFVFLSRSPLARVSKPKLARFNEF